MMPPTRRKKILARSSKPIQIFFKSGETIAWQLHHQHMRDLSLSGRIFRTKDTHSALTIPAIYKSKQDQTLRIENPQTVCSGNKSSN